MKTVTSITLTTLAMFCGLMPLAQADIMLKQSISIEASGAMSMMASQGTSTSYISGNRGRTENQMESQSKLMRKFAKNANTATIVLLGEDRMLTLMPEKQQYSEMSFQQMREQMEKAMTQMENMPNGGGLPVNEGDCQWSEPVLDIQKTGEKQKFAGVKAQQTIITASQTCKDPTSGKICDMTWNMEYWNAKRMPGKDEAQDFQQGMAKAMGGDQMLAMAKVSTRGLLSMFKKGWDDVLLESGSMKGYPVKTVMSLEIGGENCTTAAGQPIALDEMWGNAANAGMDAAAGTAAAHAGAEIGEQAAKTMGNSVGGSIAGSAIGAAGRELVSGAFSKFRKRKKKSEPVPQPANPAAGTVTLFKITTELTSISEDSVASNLFVVPSGWKKVANP